VYDYIQTGRAKLAVFSARGKEAAIALCRRGDFRGEGVLALTSLCELRLPPLLHTVFVLRIEKEALLNALHREPCFRTYLSRTWLVVTTRLRLI
jgi:hypothetical protein